MQHGLHNFINFFITLSEIVKFSSYLHHKPHNYVKFVTNSLKKPSVLPLFSRPFALLSIKFCWEKKVYSVHLISKGFRVQVPLLLNPGKKDHKNRGVYLGTSNFVNLQMNEDFPQKTKKDNNLFL